MNTKLFKVCCFYHFNENTSLPESPRIVAHGRKSFGSILIVTMARAIGALPVSVSSPGKRTICLPEPISNPRVPKGDPDGCFFVRH
jgi:hypothetical protein